MFPLPDVAFAESMSSLYSCGFLIICLISLALYFASLSFAFHRFVHHLVYPFAFIYFRILYFYPEVYLWFCGIFGGLPAQQQIYIIWGELEPNGWVLQGRVTRRYGEPIWARCLSLNGAWFQMGSRKYS